MNHKAHLKALLDEAAELQAKKDLTPEDEARMGALAGEIIQAKKDVDHDSEVAASLKAALDAANQEPHTPPSNGGAQALSLGDHFVKSLGVDGLARLAARQPVEAPAFKAGENEQTQTVPGVFAPLLTDIDTNLVRGYRRPTVTDLFGSGSISGDKITYFVEAGVDGDFATVAEAGQKPQIHVQDPTAVTEALHKIAAWWIVSDEMLSDTAFWKTEIDNRGLYMLALAEEHQLLFGDGAGTNIKGVFNRDGLQSTALDVAAKPSDITDALFDAATKINVSTGLTADGILINPTDYQTLRLSKDTNGQYIAGGPFVGQYGNGGVPIQPNLWGFNTRVSAAIPKGTIAVGAFKSAVTVYRKGGIVTKVDPYTRVTENLVRTVVEERVGLAVRRPSAIVKLTIAQE
jgi:HK97 family phage major capsid protein